MAISRGLQPRQMYQDGSIMPRLNELGTDVSSAEQMLQEINQRLQSAESTLGEGGGQLTQLPAGGTLASSVQTPNPFFGNGELTPVQGAYANAQKEAQKTRAGGFLGQVILPGEMSFDDFSNNFSSFNNFGQPMQLPIPFAGTRNNTAQGGMGGLAPMQSPIAGAMRNMAAGGGIMNAMPRQQYGLGSLVKSIGKGVKKAVSGVKDFVKSDLGKAALLAAGGYYLGGGSLLGMQRATPLGKFAFSQIPGASTVSNFFTAGDGVNKTKKAASFGDTMKVFAGGSLLGGLLNQAEEEGDPEGITRDVGALRSKLTNAYKNQRTFADSQNEDAAIAAQVETDLSEYNQDMARGMANGGRIGYALGTPEKNAIEAAGIMNLPLNKNPAGVTELDLRETGGFIPPVGVKEKADDIPAMLANNEFVFTADAVRGMGDGNVNKGAQRMYDMMKKLEKGGRV